MTTFTDIALWVSSGILVLNVLCTDPRTYAGWIRWMQPDPLPVPALGLVCLAQFRLPVSTVFLHMSCKLAAISRGRSYTSIYPYTSTNMCWNTTY